MNEELRAKKLELHRDGTGAATVKTAKDNDTVTGRCGA